MLRSDISTQGEVVSTFLSLPASVLVHTGVSSGDVLQQVGGATAQPQESMRRLQIELEEQATALAEFLDPSQGGQQSALTMAKARQLPDRVAELQTQKSASQAELASLKASTFSLSIRYAEVMDFLSLCPSPPQAFLSCVD